MNLPYLDGLADWTSKNPEKIALADESKSLTYADLYQEVQRLAEKIWIFRDQHSITGFLPIFVDRDVESACLALTCLVYSIPFTPIDIEWTKERVKYALSELGNPSAVLATKNSHNSIANILPDGTVLDFPGSETWNALEGKVEESVKVIAADQEVLVIFTSGTTGTPKGVVHEKRGLEQRLNPETQMGNASETGATPLGDTVSLVCHPFHFVGGLYRLYDLTQGASLYVCSVSEMSLERFLPLINKLQVSTLSLPPSLAILMSSQATKFDHLKLPTVKQIRWGGDSISYDTLHGLKSFFNSNTTARNGYGGSESLTWTTFEFPLHECPPSGPIPIARYEENPKYRLEPLEGDSERFIILLPAPTAKGYLNNPVLTAERFVVDEHGKGWWNTGDVVRIQDDGFVYHDSRIDDLVKIRGKLVSPSEARHALLSIEGIDDAVVLPVEVQKDKQLVAHIQLAKGSTLSASDVRKGLERILPTYLMPTRIMRHLSIPKNSRGKPDRKKLYEMEFVDFLSRPIKTPVTETERTVYRVSKTVTGNPTLSVDDDLWEHGLDSLSALEMEGLLGDFFPQVTVDLLAEQRSVERIAFKLDKSAADDKSISVVFNSDSKSGVVYAFPGIGNLGTHYSILSGLLTNKPKVVVYKYQRGSLLEEETSIEAKAKSLASIIIKEEPALGPINLMGYSAGGALAYRVAQLLLESERSVRLAILDTPIQVLTTKTYLSDGKPLRNPETPEAIDVVRAKLKAFNVGMKRQGFRRGLKVVLIERPLKFLIDRQSSRKSLLTIARACAPIIPMDIRVLMTDLLTSRSLREFKAKPFEERHSKHVNALYVYVKGNNSLELWPQFVPGVSFAFAEGNHATMLAHPHINGLAEKLSDFFQLVDTQKKVSKS